MAKYVAERARGSGACFHTCEFTNWHERTLACGTSTCLSALLFLLFDFILFKWISPYSIWSVQQVRPSMCETPPILPDGSPRQRSRIRSLARSMGCFFFFFGYHINLPGGRFFFFFFVTSRIFLGVLVPFHVGACCICDLRLFSECSWLEAKNASDKFQSACPCVHFVAL